MAMAPLAAPDRIAGPAHSDRAARKHEGRTGSLSGHPSVATAHYINLAAHFAAGFKYDTFRAGSCAVYSVTRCPEF
jgi:hypothetical protein